MPPPVDRPPAATTVLDLQHEEHPEFFGRAELAYRKVVYGWTIRRSRTVITISEHARETLIERYGLAPERVRAIHLAVDPERFRVSGSEPQSPEAPYLLYPARPWRHKNHARLYEAFRLLRRERPELRLVLTGEGDYGPLLDGVEARGRVSADELVGLYRGAAALVFPSLYEGFGMPVVEAMACGCPVASSNVTSLPEVAGDAARLFDPRDPEAIAAAVDDVLRDPAPWIARGLERAKLFTWDACARAHDAVYSELSS
jgi:glycosyltransferase involved in cell wall biosynthesis